MRHHRHVSFNERHHFNRRGVRTKPRRRARRRTHTKMGIRRRHQREPYLSRFSSQFFEVGYVRQTEREERPLASIQTSVQILLLVRVRVKSQKQNAEKMTKSPRNRTHLIRVVSHSVSLISLRCGEIKGRKTVSK